MGRLVCVALVACLVAACTTGEATRPATRGTGGTGGSERLIEIPDLRGLSLREAARTLLTLGLIPGEWAERYNDDVPRGALIRTQPPAGQEVAPGTVIDYTMSLGPEPGPTAREAVPPSHDPVPVPTGTQIPTASPRPIPTPTPSPLATATLAPVTTPTPARAAADSPAPTPTPTQVPVDIPRPTQVPVDTPRPMQAPVDTLRLNAGPTPRPTPIAVRDFAFGDAFEGSGDRVRITGRGTRHRTRDHVAWRIGLPDVDPATELRLTVTRNADQQQVARIEKVANGRRVVYGRLPQLTRPGTYTVRLYVDGQLLETERLTIVGPPIPQPTQRPTSRSRER
jgi:hypothetical protein